MSKSNGSFSRYLNSNLVRDAGLGGWRSTMVAFLPLLAFAAIYFIANYHSLINTAVKGSDYSLISLQAHQAKSLGVYVGPYSRFSFNHPGPIQFYLYALSELLPLTHSAAHATIQMLLNFAALLTSFVISQRLLGVRFAVIFFSCLIVQLHYVWPGIISDTWGPSIIQIPFAVFLLSAAAFLCGGMRWMLPLVVSFSWLLSNHIGMLVPVALVLIPVMWRIWRFGIDRRVSLYSSLIFFAFFALPVFELFTASPLNNFQRFLRFLARYDPSVNSFEVWQALAGASPLGAGGAAFLVIFAVGLLIRLGEGPLRISLMVGLLALTGVCISLTQTVGQLHPYLAWPSGVAIALLVALVIEWLTSKLRISHATAICWCFSLVVSVWYGLRYQHDAGNVPDSYDKIMERIEATPSKTFRLFTKQHKRWELMTAVADTLARRGDKFCVQDRLAFLFGSHLTCDSLKENQPSATETLWFNEY